MKIIKINYTGFWPGFKIEKSIIYEILSERYDIEISDDPDYLFCSVFGEKYAYCKFDGIRIMWSGENYIPDFNLIDYGISSYPLELQDRHFSTHCLLNAENFFLSGKVRNFNFESIKDRIYFANFICGHESENNIRGDFFKLLSKYKRVESCGTYLNNMPNGETVKKANKIDFQKKCKFTLCFESTKHEGFITEKIIDAFLANTIPVYYGSSDVVKVFNPKAFINCSDYPNFEAVIDKIKELDNDDDKYLEVLNQPVLNDGTFFEKQKEDLKNFLFNIFDQPYDKAFRRSRVYCAKRYNDYLKQAKPINLFSEKQILEEAKKIEQRDNIEVKKDKGAIFAFFYKFKKKFFS